MLQQCLVEQRVIRFLLPFQEQLFQVLQKVQYLANARCYEQDLYQVSLLVQAFVRQKQSTSSRNSYRLRVHQQRFGLRRYLLSPHCREERRCRKYDHQQMGCLQLVFL